MRNSGSGTTNGGRSVSAQFPVDAASRRLDRAFAFVSEQEDFPERGEFSSADTETLPPHVKRALVRLYEQKSGLKVLREDDPGQEG